MAEFTVAGVCYNKYEAELAGKLRDAVNVWGREKHVMQTWYIADDDNPDPAFLRRVQGPVREWMADRFEDTDVIICICPVVRAVRYIGRLMVDQLNDPAVLAVDASGKYCVPVLSGRRGEAFELAMVFESRLGMEFINPVMPEDPTHFDIGIYAKKHDMILSNTDYAKEIGAAIGTGGEAGFYTTYPVLGSIPGGMVWANSGALGVYVSPSYQNAYFKHTLWLIPKCLTIGLVFEPGMSVRRIDRFVQDVLRDASLYPEALEKFAVPKGLERNPAIGALALEQGVSLVAWPEEELQEIRNGDGSALTLCEQAAIKGSGGKLIVSAVTSDGISCAIAEKNFYLTF